MRTLAFGIFWACLMSTATPVLAQQQTEMEILRAELAQMRVDYESRIAQLEQRLDAAEKKAIVQQTTPVQITKQTVEEENPWQPDPYASQVRDDGNSAFNPAIGVIFQGQAWAYENDPDHYVIPGFPLGGHAGPAAEGFSLGETEINISANVDDKFTAWLTTAIAIEHGEAVIEVEEAWIETMTLPAGMSLRVGRFFSSIGYLNDIHAHNWDFADSPLPYQAFLGNHYIDDGLQFDWLAPTDFYLELGGEITRGGHYPASGAGNSGFGGFSLHALTGGDVGNSHSWQAGLSYLQVEAEDRESGGGHDHDHDHGALSFSGDTDLVIAEFVWKWSPNGNWRQKNFVIQAEYLWRNEDGTYTLPESEPLPYDTDQQGWYLQAVYQPFPRWRIGVRYDQLSSDYPGDEFIDTPLMPAQSDPRRYSIMADWSNSEFSRLRLQYMLNKAGHVDDNQFGLQYIFSIGAHGAHTF